MSDMTGTITSPHWQIRELTLVNWGAYDGGPHRFSFPVLEGGSLSLISGFTGVGKSTAIDAYLVLTMRSRVSLNRASAGSDEDRRARDLYTYSRGYLGKVSVDGRERPVYLRGQDPETGAAQATWSFISAEFVSAFGDVVTIALVTWIAPGEPSRPTSQVWLLADGTLDPLAAESVAAERITPAVLRRVYTEARVVSENKEVMRRAFHEVTGTSLLSEDLVYRNLVSGGGSDINSLFRDSVLEQPASVEKAEAFVTSYDQAVESFNSVRRIQKRNQDLDAIRRSFEAYRDLEGSRISFGRWALPSSEGDGPSEGDRLAINRWVARDLLVKMDASVESAERALEEASNQLEEAKSALEGANERVRILEKQYSDSGGGHIETLREKVASLEREKGLRERRSNAFAALFARIGEDLPNSLESWKSRTALFGSEADYDKMLSDAQARADKLTVEIHDSQKALKKACANLAEAERSGTRLTSEMRSARKTLAGAAGLTESQIVFGAEIMDVLPEHADWRLAVNVGFVRIADTLFISALDEREFMRRVEGTPAERVGRRQRYEFVDLAQVPDRPSVDNRMLSGKLKFDWESRFAPFVASMVTSPSEDWLCVESGEDLTRCGGRQITKASQTKVGSRGAYGTARNRPDFIGFVDEDYLSSLRDEVRRAREANDELTGRKAAAQSKVADINAERRLADEVRSTEWAEIDWRTTDYQLEAYKRQLDEARSDEDLAQLERWLNEARDRQYAEQERMINGKRRKKERERDLEGLREWHDELEEASKARLDLMDIAGTLEETVRTAWGLASSGISDEPTLADKRSLDERVNKVFDTVRARALDTARQARAQASALTQSLERFQDEYAPDIGSTLRGLGTSPEDARLYLDLIRQEENWADALVSNQAEAIHRQLALLLDFAQAVRSYETDVLRSMRKIGGTLSNYDFDREGGKLRVEPRFRNTVRDSDFATMVNDLLRETFKETSITTLRGMEPARREGLIERLGEIAGRLRGDGAEARRNCDPRRRFVAKVYVTHSDGRPDSVISDYSGSSGGERERIKSFILAAAIGYALDTPNDDRPRFATIIYDEAFVKSDVRTTRMSIEALKGLGFQLIVSCPDSKLGAIHSLAESTCLTTRPTLDGPAFINYEERAGGA